jgi:transmembrane sensor
MEREALARIEEQALEWHALQRQGGLTATQQAQFMEWLVTSPEHLREYLAVGRFAAELAEAMRAMPADDASREPEQADNVVLWPRERTRQAPLPGRSRRARMPRFAAAAVVVLAVGFIAHLAWPQSVPYVAAHGQPRRIELPDGTVAHLNAESALRIRYGLTQRRIELERGQASFIVADDRRPLSVHAAGLQVQDIGTTFDVSLQREQARIGVAEGRVAIIGEEGDGRILADLSAGQSARVAYRDQLVRLTDEDADAMLAWWTRRIVFRDEALREVADQFNRLNVTQLDVDDDAGALRLTGNLRGDDLASMRAFLDQQPTLVTHVTPHGIRVSSRVADRH